MRLFPSAVAAVLKRPHTHVNELIEKKFPLYNEKADGSVAVLAARGVRRSWGKCHMILVPYCINNL